MKKKLILALFSVALAFTSEAQNLVSNPGFEAEMANWNRNLDTNSTVDATFDVSSSAYEGAYSFQANVKELGANPWDIMLMQDLETIKGEHYELSFFAKAEVEGVKIRPQFQNTTYTATDISLTKAWKAYKFPITAKEDNLQLVFQFFQKGVFYLDNLQVVVKEKPVKALITNGSFEKDTQGWVTMANDGANAKFTVLDSDAKDGTKSLTTLVLLPGKNTWSIASIVPFPAVKYKKYKLKFYAKSSSAGNRLKAQIQKTTYSPKDFTITSDWQAYEYVFSAKENNMEVAFQYLDSGLYYIDGVTMELLSKPKKKKTKKSKKK